MRSVVAMGLGLWLAACGNDSGAGPTAADADSGAVTDISGTDAVAGTDALADIATDVLVDATTDVLGDVVTADAPDGGQCLPLFTACPIDAKKNPCCPPYSCMNLGNGPQCQAEGPDIQQPDVPDAVDSGPDGALGDICTTDDVIPGPSCGAGNPTFFPTFSKTCGADSECAVAFHQINCCGTKVAWGLLACEMAPFSTAETQCEGQYPGCGCAEFQTMAEDGYSSFTATDFAAKCVFGTCRSTIPSATPTCTAQGLQEPKPVKTCAASSDCDFAIETLDCCGSLMFTGIAKFAKPGYDALEKTCVSTMGLCNCPPAPTKLDDGSVLTTNAVPVTCVNGACTTGKP